MNYQLAQIKEMAYIYRMSKNQTIREAVANAYEAYEIFRDAEFEVQIKNIE